MAEEDPWGFDDGDVVAEETTAPIAGVAAVGPAGAVGAAPGETRPVMDVPAGSEADGHYRKPITLYKHWVRPRFLQYNYMYDYRHNYYNDVIDYLDMRNRGLKPEVPRAQTWAERVLRTHTRTDDVYQLMTATTAQLRPTPTFSSSYDVYDSYLTKKGGEPKLIQTLSSSIKPTNYHSRAYISRKYASVL